MIFRQQRPWRDGKASAEKELPKYLIPHQTAAQHMFGTFESSRLKLIERAFSARGNSRWYQQRCWQKHKLNYNFSHSRIGWRCVCLFSLCVLWMGEGKSAIRWGCWESIVNEITRQPVSGAKEEKKLNESVRSLSRKISIIDFLPFIFIYFSSRRDFPSVIVRCDRKWRYYVAIMSSGKTTVDGENTFRDHK